MMKSALAFILLAALGACAKAKESLPDVRLPTLSSQPGLSLASCPTPKCLTVYLAPWCPYCRDNTPLIKETAAFLKARGVETRIIVGLDRPVPLQEYARAIGPATMLDVNQSLELKGGVPHFFVSNASGEILREVGGLPYGPRSPEQLAAAFGLP